MKTSKQLFEQKAKRKAKTQREDSLRKKNAQERKARKPLSKETMKIEWKKLEAPELNDEDPVLVKLKSFIKSSYEFVSAKTYYDTTGKHPVLMIELNLKKDESTYKFPYKYNGIKRSLGL